MIKENTQLPKFELNDADGNVVRSGDLKGKKCVIYFYPKDFTPGCTIQACSLRDINKELNNNDVIILGVSYDSSKKHGDFSKEHKLNFPLLSDIDKSVSKLYNSEGWFFPKRKTFIIDENGIIAHIIDPVDVNTHNDVILSVIDSLKTEKVK